MKKITLLLVFMMVANLTKSNANGLENTVTTMPHAASETEYIYFAAWHTNDNDYFISPIYTITLTDNKEEKINELKNEFIKRINNGGYSVTLFDNDIMINKGDGLKNDFEKQRGLEIQQRQSGNKKVIVIN